MNELQVNVTQKPGAVQWNFEELVNALQAQMQQYEAMVYTEDTVKDAKADVAALRKLRSEVESRRKEIRNKCLEPYGVIEEQAKILTGMIDKPIAKISEQVEEYTEKRKQEKKEEILTFMRDTFADLPDNVSAKLRFKVYDPKWENATATKKAYKDTITSAYQATKSDLAILEGVDPDYKEAAMQAYIKDLSLQDAMAKAQELQKQKEIVLENERRRKAEQERLEQERAAREKAQAEVAARQKEEQEAQAQAAPVFPPKQESAKAPEMPFGEPSVGAFEVEKEIAVRVMVPESRMEEFEQAMQNLFMRYEVI